MSAAWTHEAELLAASVGVAVLGGASLLALGRHTPDEIIRRELRFGGDLTENQVGAVLDVVAGIGRGRTVRLLLVAGSEDIRFALAGGRGVIETLERAVAAVAPSVRLSSVADGDGLGLSTPETARGALLDWTGRYPLLRADHSDAGAAGLLGAVSGLRRGEQVWLQLVLSPAGRVQRPAIEQAAASRRGLLERAIAGDDTPVDATSKRAVLSKFASPLLRARLIVAAAAGDPRRAHQLLARVAGAVRTRSGPRGSLRVRSLSAGRRRRVWDAGAGRGDLLLPAELVALLGWPIAAPRLPELRYGLAPQRLADRIIPSGGPGRTFGDSTWPGAEGRMIVQPWAGASCHSLLLGPSGSGKSWLLAGLLIDQVASGGSAVLLDMKGDTAGDVLARMPARRRDQVLVIEPSNGLAVPGLHSFAGPPELAADLLLGVFRGLNPRTFGVRSERYLRMAFQTLAVDRSATVADAPRLFGDPGYRRKVVGRLSDPLLLGQWSEFEALPEAQKAEHLTSPLSKLTEVLSRRVVRTMLAQPRPKLTVAEAVARGMVVIASFPPGRLGGPAAQLLGALVVYEVSQAIVARQGLDPARRRPLGFYVDEPAVLGALPVPLDSLFETARGMGCGVTMAAQSLTQLPAAVAQAATTNASTIACFRPGADDATRIARELPGVSAGELQQLDPFTMALRLGLAPGQIAPVCTVRSRPLGSPTADPDDLRRHSAERFGVAPAEVDEALRRRHGLAEPQTTEPGAETPTPLLGERRRPS